MAKTRPAGRGESETWPRRGEIYLVALDPTVGHEIQKTRPALVVQNDVSNRHSAITIVAPITSTVRLPLSPFHVLLPADEATGLTVASVAVFNQVRAVDRTRLVRRLGRVAPSVMELAADAIQAVFGIRDREDDPQYTVTRAISRSTGNVKTRRYEP
jgi:mRNA interferase MazF